MLADAIYPVEGGDFRFLGLASRFFDSDYVTSAFNSLTKLHVPVVGNKSDALRRLKYVAEGGRDAFKIPDLDRPTWIILSHWEDWQRARLTMKARWVQLDKITGLTTTYAAFVKRCARMGLRHVK